MSDNVMARPQRGRRPANRRALVLAAATGLFADRGYEHVSMSDIAESVEVRPSALYRHFPSKQELLVEVIVHEVSAFEDVVRAAAPQELARTLSSFGLDHRAMGVLWQREVRHLPVDLQAGLRADVREAARRLATKIAERRPDLSGEGRDLVAWAVLAALTSPSFHGIELPGATFRTLMAAILDRMLAAPVVEDALSRVEESAVGLSPQSRREALLSEAVRLFAERSFASVSMEDLGAAVGMAGPSVYNHFSSKNEILATALSRGTGFLQTELMKALGAAATPVDALRRLARDYAAFAGSHHDLVTLLISEVRNLHDADRLAVMEAQRAYVAEWVHLLVSVRPDLDTASARVEVQAGLMVANDLARTPHLRRYAGADHLVALMCLAVMGVAADAGPGEPSSD